MRLSERQGIQHFADHREGKAKSHWEFTDHVNKRRGARGRLAVTALTPRAVQSRPAI